MNSPPHCRSLSSSGSWSAVTGGGPVTVTGADSLAPARGETADGYTNYPMLQVLDRSENSFTEEVAKTGLHGDMNGVGCLEKDDTGERLSQSSADSWVEVTPAELGVTVEAQRTPVDVAAGPRVADAAQSLAPLPSVLEDAEAVSPSLLAPNTPSYNDLKRNKDANVSPLTQLMMGDAVTAFFGEVEAAAEGTNAEQLSSSSPDALDLDDVVASADCDEAESKLTVNVDPEDVTCVSSLGIAASPATMIGVTETLRRRVVQEDLLRTERGPSELSPEERATVLQALFGDLGNVPISAEKFREVMVPYRRQCECLGASYGFHHQGCRYFADFPVSL
ncbi:hypothetical protein LSCM1_03034 [Leishmania martiniquensis]|uniref:Uncharacterized protein n=1 Tax=Leishmania martiniquensis TaxID=1580590 RepID=A0A836GYG9_9TRYP|nr:hypothetical protein LSCM1_03034 [Leishmania martiniquensis]